MVANLMNAQSLLNENPFKPAVRQQTKIKMALVGMPGTGKTYTAMYIAKQWGLKTAVIDSERGSASLYADMFKFDVLTLEGDYHPQKYINLIQSAEKHGYEVLIIDSLSHPWSGAGGLLQIADKLKGGSRNKFAGWAQATPFHHALVSSILDANMHIIGTFRGKNNLESDDVDPIFDHFGIKPDQKDGFLHEFHVNGVMDHANVCHIAKSRAHGYVNSLDVIVPANVTVKDRGDLKVHKQITYDALANSLMDWANKGANREQMFFADAPSVMTWVNALYAVHKTDSESLNDFGGRIRGYLNTAYNSGFDKLQFFAGIYTEAEATEIIKTAVKQPIQAEQPDNPTYPVNGSSALDPAAVDDDELETAQGETTAFPKAAAGKSGQPTAQDESPTDKPASPKSKK